MWTPRCHWIDTVEIWHRRVRAVFTWPLLAFKGKVSQLKIILGNIAILELQNQVLNSRSSYLSQKILLLGAKDLNFLNEYLREIEAFFENTLSLESEARCMSKIIYIYKKFEVRILSHCPFNDKTPNRPPGLQACRK